jgi:hypothetical protein
MESPPAEPGIRQITKNAQNFSNALFGIGLRCGSDSWFGFSGLIFQM